MDRLHQRRIVPLVNAGDVRRPCRCLGVLQCRGVGTAVIANFPPLIWFLVVGIVLIRQGTTRPAST
jgi:hypothetical protein